MVDPAVAVVPEGMSLRRIFTAMAGLRFHTGVAGCPMVSSSTPVERGILLARRKLLACSAAYPVVPETLDDDKDDDEDGGSDSNDIISLSSSVGCRRRWAMT